MDRTRFQRLFGHLYRSQVERFRPKYDLFISYKFADSVRYAENLADRVSDAGYTFFLDVNEIPSSANEHTACAYLVHGLKSAGTMLVIMSQHATESEWVRWEMRSMTRLKRMVWSIIPDASPHGALLESSYWTLTESDASFALGKPSDHIIEQVQESCTQIRHRTRRLRPSSYRPKQREVSLDELYFDSPVRKRGVEPSAKNSIGRKEFTIREWMDIEEAKRTNKNERHN